MNTKSLLLWCAALAAHPAFGKIKTATVAYQDGDTALEGFVAYDDAKADKESWAEMKAFFAKLFAK